MVKVQQTFASEPSLERCFSLLLGKDSEALEMLISLHAISNPRILDCTFGMGTMWKKCRFQPTIKLDIRQLEGIVQDDFTTLSKISNESVDVVVFDPPHLPTHAASGNSSKIWEERYGITNNGELRKGDNVTPLFKPFLAAAFRVLSNNGIVLAKISDLVHNHKYQWQQVAFVNACQESGFTACDLLIKSDPNAGNLMSSKWTGKPKHLRKAHCYWIVARKGKCEAPS